MWNRLVSLAKSAVVALESADAQILRFTVTASFGFGLQVRATIAGRDAFLARVKALGLVAEVNRMRLLDEKRDPPVYLFDMFVEIPGGWTK